MTLARDFGVTPRWLEQRSTTTLSNAAYSAQMLHAEGIAKVYLVTNAWHMPRAMGWFRRGGFAVEPWPVDYRTPRPLDMTRVYNSIPEGLRRMDFVTREYVGLVVYYLTGRIEALLPGP